MGRELTGKRLERWDAKFGLGMLTGIEVDEAAGRARIEVSFLDDLVALRAFRDAIAFLGDAMVR